LVSEEPLFYLALLFSTEAQEMLSSLITITSHLTTFVQDPTNGSPRSGFLLLGCYYISSLIARAIGKHALDSSSINFVIGWLS
jgi:hypothetical protein